MLEVNPIERIGLEQALNHKWFEVAKGENKSRSNSELLTVGETCSEEKSSEIIKLIVE